MRAREFERDLAILAFWTRSEIDQCTRQLRQAGLLPVGGRGLNAPKITAMHASLILIGLTASHRAADIADAVEAYGSMPALTSPLDGAATFGEALASILTNWVELKPKRSINSIVVCSTWPEATINLTKAGRRRSEMIVYGASDVEHPGPGMRADVTFSPATLSMLALNLRRAQEVMENG
jgi:hypothetical protein